MSTDGGVGVRRFGSVLFVAVILGGTSIALAQGPTPTGDLVVANAYAPVDALTGGPLASRLGAPLVTTRVGTVPEGTVRQVENLRPSRVILLGGSVVINSDVEDYFRSLSWNPEVVRLGGADRFETSELIADFLAEQPLPAAGSVDGASLDDLVTDLQLVSRFGTTSDPVEQVVPVPQSDGERNAGAWVRTGPLRTRLVCEPTAGSGLPEVEARLEMQWAGDGVASQNPFSRNSAYVNASIRSDITTSAAGMTGLDGGRVIETSADGWVSINATTPDACQAVWSVTIRPLPTSGG